MNYFKYSKKNNIYDHDYITHNDQKISINSIHSIDPYWHKLKVNQKISEYFTKDLKPSPSDKTMLFDLEPSLAGIGKKGKIDFSRFKKIFKTSEPPQTETIEENTLEEGTSEFESIPVRERAEGELAFGHSLEENELDSTDLDSLSTNSTEAENEYHLQLFRKFFEKNTSKEDLPLNKGYQKIWDEWSTSSEENAEASRQFLKNLTRIEETDLENGNMIENEIAFYQNDLKNLKEFLENYKQTKTNKMALKQINDKFEKLDNILDSYKNLKNNANLDLNSEEFKSFIKSMDKLYNEDFDSFLKEVEDYSEGHSYYKYETVDDDITEYSFNPQPEENVTENNSIGNDFIENLRDYLEGASQSPENIDPITGKQNWFVRQNYIGYKTNKDSSIHFENYKLKFKKLEEKGGEEYYQFLKDSLYKEDLNSLDSSSEIPFDSTSWDNDADLNRKHPESSDEDLPEPSSSEEETLSEKESSIEEETLSEETLSEKESSIEEESTIEENPFDDRLYTISEEDESKLESFLSDLDENFAENNSSPNGNNFYSLTQNDISDISSNNISDISVAENETNPADIISDLEETLPETETTIESVLTILPEIIPA